MYLKQTLLFLYHCLGSTKAALPNTSSQCWKWIHSFSPPYPNGYPARNFSKVHIVGKGKTKVYAKWKKEAINFQHCYNDSIIVSSRWFSFHYTTFLVQLKYRKKKICFGKKSQFVQSGPYTVQVCEATVWGMTDSCSLLVLSNLLLIARNLI